MKIANIIEDARLGGPQVRIAEVAKRLKNTEYETTVIIPQKDNARFKKRLDVYGVSFKELPLHRLTKEPKHLILFVLLFFYELLMLYRYLKKEHFDIVHVSGGSWQWKGVLAGRMAGCKVLWHLNDTKMPLYVRFFFKPLAKYCADGFIVAGSRVKSYYLDKLRIKKNAVHEIQAPVDCDVFNPEKVQEDKKLENYDGIKVVTIANINPIKGLETFIKVAEKVSKDYNNVNFFIVGPVYSSQKNYYAKLKSLIVRNGLEKCVHFYGGTDDVKPILKSADIYVCSSLAEASPVSVWEAMAMCKPIVSTDVGDISRFVEDKKSGYIFNVGDYESMANGLNILIENFKIRTQLGLNAQIKAKNYLDIEVITQKHRNKYESYK